MTELIEWAVGECRFREPDQAAEYSAKMHLPIWRREVTEFVMLRDDERAKMIDAIGVPNAH
jgi:hypothetical protein